MMLHQLMHLKSNIHVLTHRERHWARLADHELVATILLPDAINCPEQTPVVFRLACRKFRRSTDEFVAASAERAEVRLDTNVNILSSDVPGIRACSLCGGGHSHELRFVIVIPVYGVFVW